MRAVKATPTGLDIRVESPEKALPAILRRVGQSIGLQLEFIGPSAAAGRRVHRPYGPIRSKTNPYRRRVCDGLCVT